MRPAKPREDILVEAECYQLTRAIAFVGARAYKLLTTAPSPAPSRLMLGANRATRDLRQPATHWGALQGQRARDEALRKCGGAMGAWISA